MSGFPPLKIFLGCREERHLRIVDRRAEGDLRFDRFKKLLQGFVFVLSVSEQIKLKSTGDDHRSLAINQDTDRKVEEMLSQDVHCLAL